MINMGHWALGMGHGALGEAKRRDGALGEAKRRDGAWAWGIGHWLLER